MKIRTQLVVAFLLLSVLPLTVIVLYSYHSSLEAVRVAYETEAAQMSKDMGGRMSAIRQDIRHRVFDIGKLPLEQLAGNKERSDAVRAMMVDRLGDAAPFIQSFEFVPQMPRPAAPRQPFPYVAPVAPEPPVPGLRHDPMGEGHAAHEVQLPIVIDVAQILREARESTKALPPEKQYEIMAGLKRDLEHVPAPPPPAPSDADLSNEERKQLAEEQKRELAAATQEAVDDALSAVGEQVDAEVEESRDRADQQRRLEAQRSRERIAALRAKIRDRASKIETKKQETKLVFRQELEVPVTSDGSVVGKVKATVSGREVLNRVLRSSRPQEGEIAFALDRDGVVYTVKPQDKALLAPLPLKDIAGGKAVDEKVVNGWVLATNRDPESGVTYGIARPIRRPLEKVKETAARNFAYGLGLVALALFGIVPIANHMTRDVQSIAQGAERIAQGDLTTRVPVRSSNEFGNLAESFNRMARDLSDHQLKLFEEEGRRREQELQQKLLAAEYGRKSQELEEARSFQLSLLPKQVPALPGIEIDVFMRTAAEVGGDYYDFHADANGVLTTVVGDATGHGARAATMVTVIKSLFAGYDAATPPSRFLDDANETVKRMQLGRMAMGLTLARLEGKTLTVAAAGMPPVLIRRSDGTVREVELSGTPIGTLTTTYMQRTVELVGGETILLMSDGFPELMNASGEPFGYARVEEALSSAGAGSPTDVIRTLTRLADSWSDAESQNDDITFVALRLA